MEEINDKFESKLKILFSKLFQNYNIIKIK